MKTKLFFRVCLFLAALTLSLHAGPKPKIEPRTDHNHRMTLEQKTEEGRRQAWEEEESEPNRDQVNREEQKKVANSSGIQRGDQIACSEFSEQRIIKQLAHIEKIKKLWSQDPIKLPNSNEEHQEYLKEMERKVQESNSLSNRYKEIADQQAEGPYKTRLNQVVTACKQIAEMIQEPRFPFLLHEELIEQGHHYLQERRTQKNEQRVRVGPGQTEVLIAGNSQMPIDSEASPLVDRYALDSKNNDPGFLDARKAANIYHQKNQRNLWLNLSVESRRAYNNWIDCENHNYHQKKQRQLDKLKNAVREGEGSFWTGMKDEFMAYWGLENRSKILQEQREKELQEQYRKLEQDREALDFATRTPEDREALFQEKYTIEGYAKRRRRERMDETINCILNDYSCGIYTRNPTINELHEKIAIVKTRFPEAAKMYREALRVFEKEVKVLDERLEELRKFRKENEDDNEELAKAYDIQRSSLHDIRFVYEQAAQQYRQGNQQAGEAYNGRASFMEKELEAKLANNQSDCEKYSKESKVQDKLASIYQLAFEQKRQQDQQNQRAKEAHSESEKWYQYAAKTLIDGREGASSLGYRFAKLFAEIAKNAEKNIQKSQRSMEFYSESLKWCQVAINEINIGKEEKSSLYCRIAELFEEAANNHVDNKYSWNRTKRENYCYHLVEACNAQAEALIQGDLEKAEQCNKVAEDNREKIKALDQRPSSPKYADYEFDEL